MTQEQGGEGAVWSSRGQVDLSDADIVSDMIARLKPGEETAVTAESIYKAYLEVNKASDTWMKYYMISVALLIMAAIRATSEVSLLGAKVTGPFIGPAAIVFFSVCLLVYTNHELKMRFFRAFFDARLSSKDGPDRAETLLRYPLAFYGTQFLPYDGRPKGFVLGWKQVLGLIPVLLAGGVGWLTAGYGLIVLLGYSLWGVYAEAALPLPIKVAVFAVFLCSMIFSGTALRNPKSRHKYET